MPRPEASVSMEGLVDFTEVGGMAAGAMVVGAGAVLD